MKGKIVLNLLDTDRVIEMAWEDRTPFDAIKFQFGLSEQQVIELMRQQIKRSSFKRWRTRVQGRSTKHTMLSFQNDFTFKCDRQRQISFNKISKKSFR